MEFSSACSAVVCFSMLGAICCAQNLGTGQISYVFLYLWGGKKPCYNRNLAISKLVVNYTYSSIEQHKNKRKQDRENLASLKPVPHCIRAC